MADRHNRDIDRAPAPLPQPLQTKVADSHAHLELIFNSEPDDLRLGNLIKECESVGVTRIVQVGYSLEQSKWGIKCAEHFVGKVVATVALHPNEAPVVDDLDNQISEIAKLAKNNRVRGIGETGLDFFRTPKELQDKQRYSFEQHIEIAKQTDKALIIHDRDAHEAVFETLEKVGAPAKTIFHCYSGDAQFAKRAIASGYILSFAGTVTFKNAPHLRAALELVPAEQLLVETDSPFLAPMPNRGLLNTPAQIPNTLRQMALVRGESVDYLSEQIDKNIDEIFGEF
jgi:TatD DNase family protein